MGSESGSDYVYDLRRIEDIFACLEIISIARGALFGVDPKLAARMEQVSDALGFFSQLVLEGGLGESLEEKQVMEDVPDFVPSSSDGSQSEILDLTVDLPASSGKPAGNSVRSSSLSSDRPEDDGSIVDILTGEKIR